MSSGSQDQWHDRIRLEGDGPYPGGQMAERLVNRATNQKVAGSIPGCAK